MAQYLDTRDLAAELDDLARREEEARDMRVNPQDYTDEERAGLPDVELTDEEAERLAALRELESEIPDFRDGETMVPVEDFRDYAEELADDLGYMQDAKANDWPFRHIDWQAAADELAQDYTEVEWEGTAYYVRAS